MKYSLLLTVFSFFVLTACGQNNASDDFGSSNPNNDDGLRFEAKVPKTCTGAINTQSSALNVRATPEISNNICGQLERSSLVTINIDSLENDFIQIQTDMCGDNVAYVSKAYVALNEDCANNDNNAEEDNENNEDEEEVRPLIAMDWDGKHKDASLWTQFSMDALEKYGQEILATRPKDVLEFCPAYDQIDRQDRMMFWVHLLSVMTRYESFFNPSVQYQEAFPDANGNRVISRGLLQLSVESGRYFGCELENGPILHDPQTNLICGVKIMNYWLQRDKVLSERRNGKWFGAARYWAVFRTYTNRDLVAQVKARSKTAEVCEL